MSHTPWETFLQTASSHLPSHTILLHGGHKVSCAYQLAARILQDASVVEQKWNPDFYENFPSSKGGLHLIDTPRMIQKTLWLEPFSNDYKVYLVHDIDRITLPAIAAFLKILEEPPRHSVFILTSTNKQHLPATILSRCFTLYVGYENDQDPINSEVEVVLNLLSLLEKTENSNPTKDNFLTQIENVLKQKEYHKSELQNIVKKYLDILIKIVRDRFILGHQFQLDLSFPQFKDNILYIQIYPVNQVLNIVNHAAQALDNMVAPLSCFQWIFLQLWSLKHQCPNQKA